METTEHIVEAYVRYVKGWFTNSNIRARGGKEIDILAIDKSGKRYHIESGVTHEKQWSLKSRAEPSDFLQVKKKTKVSTTWRHKNSVDFFVRVKFENDDVKEKLREFGFLNRNHKRIIVCWRMANPSVAEYAKRRGIEVWELKSKIRELTQAIGDSYYSDDILRILQLARKADE